MFGLEVEGEELRVERGVRVVAGEKSKGLRMCKWDVKKRFGR